MASNAKVVFSLENYITIDIPTPTVTELNVQGSFPKIDNLEYFPEKVLLYIFSEVDDKDLLRLSDCSHRFDGIAKIVFKGRYASKYFVFDGDTKTKRKLYCDLFERFGRYANIKAVEVKYIRNIDEKHWVAKFLVQHTKQLEKLTFYRCWFKRINTLLSQHINITHLTIRWSCRRFLSEAPNNRLVLPKYRNLKKLDVSDNYGLDCDENTIVKAMRNNPALETLNLSYFLPIIPIDCIAKHLKNLKELNLIYSMAMSNETMEFVVDSLKHLESLRLTISDDRHMELVKRLSINCKNLKQLELDHIRYDEMISTDKIIEAAAQFRTVESLEFSLMKNYNSIQTLAEYLPTLHRLRHLKVFMDKPQQSDAFIPSLLNASPSLKTITITTWNGVTLLSWPELLLSTAFFKEIFKFIKEPHRLPRGDLKQFQGGYGFVTRKKIIRCHERSHWIENNSILFSFKLVSFFNFIIYFVLYIFSIFVSVCMLLKIMEE